VHNTLVIIFNIIVVIIGIYSWINSSSYKSNTKKAEKKASTLAKKLNNTKSEEDETNIANSEELDALAHYYHITIDQPVTIIEVVSDDIRISTLTENGHLSKLMLTIFDAKIETPFAFRSMLQRGIDSMSDSFGDMSNLRLALIDDKFYLLSIGLLSLIEEHRQVIPEIKKWKRDRELEKQTRELSANNVHGQIESLPLSVIGERNATENENWHFDPSNSGILYAVIMALIFTFSPLNDPDLGFIALAVCVFTLLIGFILWYRSSKAKRKKFKVTKLHGQFHEIEHTTYGSYLYVYDNEIEGKTTFSIPDCWKYNDDFPLFKDLTFEVLSGTNDIISIGNLYSLEDNFKTHPPTRKYYPWMLITLIAFAINLGVNTNLQQVKLAAQMLLAPQSITVNTLQDWTTIQVGQKLTAKNINRQCILPNKETEPDQTWKDICSHFNILNQAPNTDFLAIAAPILENLAKIDNTLTFPSISNSAYHLLQTRIRLMNAIQGSSNDYEVISQSSIAQYNNKILSNWANWINQNDKDNEEIKEQLLSMWNEISTKACTTNCWNKMLQDNSEQESRFAYETRRALLPFRTAVDNYAYRQILMLLTQWKNALNNAVTPGKNTIQLSAIGMETSHESWDELLYLYRGSYSQKNRDNQITSIIIKSAEELYQMQSTEIDSAVVKSIKHSDTGTKIILDMTMTNYLYKNYLIRIGLWLFIILFAIWITRKELHPSAVNENQPA